MCDVCVPWPYTVVVVVVCSRRTHALKPKSVEREALLIMNTLFFSCPYIAGEVSSSKPAGNREPRCYDEAGGTHSGVLHIK